MKVALCIPIHSTNPVHSNFLVNFINRLGEIDPKKFEVSIIFSIKYPIDKAREELVESALKGNADYIWFIDSDMVVPKATLETLLDLNTDVASGLYFAKGIPYLPVIRRLDDRGHFEFVMNLEPEMGKIIEVDGVGLGCCLIKAEVFKKLEKPWFLYKWDGDNVQAEDLYFCKKARKAGFKILVNTKLIVGHQGGLISEREYYNYKDLR